MARNEEKSNNLLNKWVTMKEEYARGGAKDARRPYLASECEDLGQAEQWRRQIIREVSKAVGEIQNAALGEHVIRDLNDKINKLLREKGHWNRRIKQLGGPDYNRSEPRIQEGDGMALPSGWDTHGSGGRQRYFYFGAAKTLPGVRELFEAAPAKKPKRSRAELYKTITPDYYGYRDEDDGVVLELEAAAEEKRVAEAVEAWEKDPQRLKLAEGDASDEEILEDVEEVDALVSAATSTAVKAHVPVPSVEDFRGAVLNAKRSALLSKLGIAESKA